MNFFMRFVVVAASLALTGCFNSDHIDVANMAPTGSAFQAALQKGYSDLAKHEYDEGDWHDGYGYVKKARSAAASEDVEPELVWDWDVPEEFVDELHNARDGIGFWSRMGAAEREPGLLAKAQVMYDCWIQEQEENDQPGDIARCRDGYYGASADLENAMTWDAQAPEAMAMPGPTPRPAVEPEVTGKARFYTIFFDWDKSDINPIAQRVVNAISDDWSGESKALSLVGHTDRSGADAYNQALSERRVSSVTDALTGTGFAGARISGYGVGESDPAVPTPDGVREPRNRRVIVTLQ